MHRAGFGGRRLGSDMAVAWAALAVSALAAGCYNPDLSGEGLFSCGDGKCPDGFECNAQRLCVAPGTTERRCVMGDPVDLASDVQSSADIVVDRTEGLLRVSFVQNIVFEGTQLAEVRLATRDLNGPQDEWDGDPLGILEQELALSYTAVDAREGEVALVFDDRVRLNSPEPQPQSQPLRLLKLADLEDPPRAFVGLDDGTEPYLAPGGDHVAAKILGAHGEQVLVVRQVGLDFESGVGARQALPQILVAQRGSAEVLNDIQLRDPAPPVQPITGIRNRLAVGTQGVALAYYGQNDPQGASGVPAQPVLVTLENPSSSDATPQFERLGDRILNLGIAFQRVGLDAQDGLHVVWPESLEEAGQTGAYLGMQYRTPDAKTLEVRPGGEPARGGGPAIAAWEGLLGVTYVLGDAFQQLDHAAGPLGFTLHDRDAEGDWTPLQVLDDTEGDSEQVLDLRMAASPGDEGATLFHLIYTTKRQQLRYRQIQCAP